MTSECKVKVELIDVDTTEEYIMNDKALPEPLRGWRFYRLELGGPNEDCLWEGRILLPPRADPDAVCNLIMGMQCHEAMWKLVE